MSVVLNGRKHDWVAVKVFLPSLGIKPITVSSITYPDFARAKEHVFGTGMEAIGFTFDSVKPGEGEIVFLASEADQIFAAQGSVLNDIGFPMTLSYVDIGLVARTDEFSGVHWTKVQPATSQGTDPVRITMSWKADSCKINGIPTIAQRA